MKLEKDIVLPNTNDHLPYLCPEIIYFEEKVIWYLK